MAVTRVPRRLAVVIDEQDDVAYTRAALNAHQPELGRITIQPTPASSHPATLAHDVLYALGKRLASGPGGPDIPLDSVRPAWLAAAAWSAATGIRHLVVTRAHLLTTTRLNQLLAWREATGVQLTLLWQTTPRRMPPTLASIEHHLTGLDQLHAALAASGPRPARPFFPPLPASPDTSTPTPPLPHGARLLPAQAAHTGPVPPPRSRQSCMGATATAQQASPLPALPVRPQDSAYLATLAHPLIAGALSVLAFTGTTQIALRDTRDIDLSGHATLLRTHSPGHRRCRLYEVPTWARPLLAAARAHHRLADRRPEEKLFAPGLQSGAKALRAHREHLPALCEVRDERAWR
ncbi:hypothetical protein [Streptomyces sp. NPDC127098]|uniref:hypothetical protein n=1 Tax=Streptomyces sp. NPDC127098 TaxID=3347137 RepID=UPI0036576A5C